jgi:hypothetical protein
VRETWFSEWTFAGRGKGCAVQQSPAILSILIFMRETVYWVMLVLMSLHMSAKVDTRGGGSSVANCCPNVVVRGDQVSCVEECCIICVVEST